MARASCRSWRGGGGVGGGGRESGALPFPFRRSTGQIMLRYQPQLGKKKADYLCPNRVVSLETGDAIISTGWVIIADQARVSVGDARRGMRQSLTNEGFYMCEVRRGGVPRGLARVAHLLLSDWFFFSLSEKICPFFIF